VSVREGEGGFSDLLQGREALRHSVANLQLCSLLLCCHTSWACTRPWT
jgi:hypothetical protein